MDRVWDSLLSSGPLAAVLAAGLVVLWRRLQQKDLELTELHKQRVDDLKEVIGESRRD